MRFVTVFSLVATVLSTSASLVARQSLPNCAALCLASANLNGCIQSDTHCLCTNQAFVSSTTKCIETSCTGTDLQNALSYSQALCAAVGVSLSAASSTTAAPSSTTASSPATTTTSSSTSATPSSAAAAAHGANAFVSLAALGLVALAL